MAMVFMRMGVGISAVCEGSKSRLVRMNEAYATKNVPFVLYDNADLKSIDERDTDSLTTANICAVAQR